MRLNVAGFVDVGFVRAAVARACGIDPGKVRLDAAALVREVDMVARTWDGWMLRTYWYDGAYAPEDTRHAAQRKYLDAVAATPGVQLRLGHLVSRVPAWHDRLRKALTACGVNPAEFARHFTYEMETAQKGVDAMIVLDLVRLARRGAYDIAVVFSGDRDIVEAVREAQSEGRRVTLIVPDTDAVSRELRELADHVVTLDQDKLRALHRAPAGAKRPAARPAVAPSGSWSLDSPAEPESSSQAALAPWMPIAASALTPQDKAPIGPTGIEPVAAPAEPAAAPAPAAPPVAEVVSGAAVKASEELASAAAPVFSPAFTTTETLAPAKGSRATPANCAAPQAGEPVAPQIAPPMPHGPEAASIDGLFDDDTDASAPDFADALFGDLVAEEGSVPDPVSALFDDGQVPTGATQWPGGTFPAPDFGG